AAEEWAGRHRAGDPVRRLHEAGWTRRGGEGLMAIGPSSDTMHPDDLRAWRRAHVPVYGPNRMKLGVFGTNVSHGCTITTAETTFEPTFPHNVAIARRAEALGFELLVPVGRWRGFGGPTDFNGTNLEVYTWAAALAACTERI